MFPVSRRVYTELQIYLYEKGPEGRQNTGSDGVSKTRKSHGKNVRKWLRKITSTKEVLRHVKEARNLASLSSALAFFGLFTEKVSQNSFFPYTLKSTDSNIPPRKALIFYLGRWMCLKNKQNTFQGTPLTISLLTTHLHVVFKWASLSSSVRHLHSWDMNTDNFHIFCSDKTEPSTSEESIHFISLPRTQNMLFQIILVLKSRIKK